jgi:hypothetical protein
MHHVEVLILELLPIDALAARAISLCEITALDHETLNDAVKGRALVVKWLARGTDTFLAGT